MEYSTHELAVFLKNIRESLGYSIYDVNKLCDISPSYLSLMENGKRRPSPVILKKLSSIYHINYFDLLIKAGFSDLIEDEKKSKYGTDELGNPVVSIPLLGTVKAGYNWLAEENIVDYITVRENIPNVNEYFALRVTGDSMLPLLSDGDLVIVHSQEDIESGQTAVILINGEEATIKKIIKTNEGIELHAMNPYYPIRKFTYEDMKNNPIKIIGRVKQAKIKGAFE